MVDQIDLSKGMAAMCHACEDTGALPDLSPCDCGRPRHVDDFVADPKSDTYAASWFESFRRPALVKGRNPDERKLYATYEDVRYLVTGCSRLGDVWLHSNLKYEGMSYEKRVNVDACSGWASEHHPTGRLSQQRSGGTDG